MATQDSRQGSNGQAGPDAGGHSLGPGSVIGGTWVVERLLGKGGMGAVWLARHQRLQNKRCAIKVLLGTGLRDEAYVRFAREAEIATRIGHPNIVDVLDLAALDGGEPYIVLEYLQGEVLRDRLRRKGSLSWDEVVSITRQIGSALLAAHRHDVVHRDLKPENVFLVPTDSGGTIRDHVKVLDFGISKLRGSQTLQTQEAVLLGTPQYMAPEQASGRNHEVDARSDQFALGVMVYEMLTGTPPWVADTPLGLLFQVVHAPTPSLPTSLVHVPQSAVQAIEKALSKQAADRFADVGAFVEALTGQPLQFLDGTARQFDEAGGRHVVVTSSGTTRQEDEAAATFDGSEAVTADTAAGNVPTPLLAAAPVPAPVAAPVPAPPQPAASPSAAESQSVTSPIAAPAAINAPLSASSAPPSRLPWLVAGAALAALIAVVAAFLLRSPAANVPAPQAAPEAAPAAGIVPPSAPNQAVPTQAPQVAAAAPQPTTAPAAPAAERAGPLPAPVAMAPGAQADAAPPAEKEPAAAPAKNSEKAPAKEPAKTAESDKAAPPVSAAPAELVEAEAAFASDNLPDAERKATHSLLTMRHPRAFALLTKIHCQRGDLGGARTWYGQASGGAKAQAKRYCADQGIAL